MKEVRQAGTHSSLSASTSAARARQAAGLREGYIHTQLCRQQHRHRRPPSDVGEPPLATQSVLCAHTKGTTSIHPLAWQTDLWRSGTCLLVIRAMQCRHRRSPPQLRHPRHPFTQDRHIHTVWGDKAYVGRPGCLPVCVPPLSSPLLSSSIPSHPTTCQSPRTHLQTLSP